MSYRSRGLHSRRGQALSLTSGVLPTRRKSDKFGRCPISIGDKYSSLSMTIDNLDRGVRPLGNIAPPRENARVSIKTSATQTNEIPEKPPPPKLRPASSITASLLIQS